MVDIFSNSLKFVTGSGILGGTTKFALNEIWISPQGDDATGDGSEYHPYKTLLHATSIARNTSRGELSQFSIKMHPGLYEETQTINIPRFTHIAGSNADKRMTLLTSSQNLVVHMSGQSSIHNLLVEYSTISPGTTGVMVSDVNGTVNHISRIANVGVKRCEQGVYLGFSGVLEIGANCVVDENINDLVVGDSTAYIDFVGGSKSDRATHIYPSGFDQDHGLFVSPDLDPSSDQVQISSEISLGRPDKGREASLGEGDAYTAGMVIITTDDTTTTINDGGGFQNATSSGVSRLDDSVVEFQGSTSGYSILIGSDLLSAPKHWGFSARQAQAMLANSRNPIIFERWTGQRWQQMGVMATEQDLAYVYSNNVFLRANSKEHIRYGIDGASTWARKNIGGKELYWSRMRIINDTITQLPTFNQFKLSSSRTEIASDGFVVHHGTSRFVNTLLSVGNIFGETGGTQPANVSVGSGGIPTSWTHNMPNSLLNQDGDAIHLQVFVPRGADTSFPVQLDFKYSAASAGATSSGTIIVSKLPVEVEGVSVADPSGGVIPIPRTIQATQPLNERAGQSETINIPLESTKIRVARTSGIDASNIYPGDALLIRIEYDDDGSNMKDLVVWGVEVAFSSWSAGTRI